MQLQDFIKNGVSKAIKNTWAKLQPWLLHAVNCLLLYSLTEEDFKLRINVQYISRILRPHTC